MIYPMNLSNPSDVILFIGGDDNQHTMTVLGNKLVDAGIDVTFDRRVMSVRDRLEDIFERGAKAAVMVNDAAMATDRYQVSQKGVPISPEMEVEELAPYLDAVVKGEKPPKIERRPKAEPKPPSVSNSEIDAGSLPDFDYQNPTELVVFGFGTHLQQTAIDAGHRLMNAGISVSYDRKATPLFARTRDYEALGVKLFVGVGDDDYNRGKIRVTEPGKKAGPQIDIEDLAAHVENALNRIAGEPVEEEPPADNPAVRKAVDDFIATKAESEQDSETVDGDIPSWPLGSQEWMGSMTKTSLDSMGKMKAEWKLNGKPRVPVFINDRIYVTLLDGSNASGISYDSLRLALRKGQTEWNGHSIGYADPALDAIRRGIAREEFAAGVRDDSPPTQEPPADDPVIESGDDSWKGIVSNDVIASIERRKAEWSLSGNSPIPVIVDGRLYPTAREAGKVINPGIEGGGKNLSRALREGRTEYKGHAVSYAVPEFNAIARGMTREQFEAQRRGEPPAAVDPEPVNGVLAGDLLEAVQKEANGAKGESKAVEEAAAPAAGNVVAVLIEGEDGEIKFDRDFDFQTAQRVIAHCQKVATKAARVSL